MEEADFAVYMLVTLKRRLPKFYQRFIDTIYSFFQNPSFGSRDIKQKQNFDQILKCRCDLENYVKVTKILG